MRRIYKRKKKKVAEQKKEKEGRRRKRGGETDTGSSRKGEGDEVRFVSRTTLTFFPK